jgi:hypothetical protein
MTRRSEWQHRKAELRARLMTGVANRLFSSKTTGLDGFLKRRMGVPTEPRDAPKREARSRGV